MENYIKALIVDENGNRDFYRFNSEEQLDCFLNRNENYKVIMIETHEKLN